MAIEDSPIRANYDDPFERAVGIASGIGSVDRGAVRVLVESQSFRRTVEILAKLRTSEINPESELFSAILNEAAENKLQAITELGARYLREPNYREVSAAQIVIAANLKEGLDKNPQ